MTDFLLKTNKDCLGIKKNNRPNSMFNPFKNGMDIIKKAKELNNSVKINLFLINYSNGNCDILLSSFYKQLIKKRVHKEKYKRAFSVIISNLIYNDKINKEKFLTVSLSKSYFLKEMINEKDNLKKINYDVFISIFNWMVKEELICFYIGFKNEKKSRHTRFRSTEKLLNLIKNEDNYLIKNENNVLFLKNKEKNNINFKDNREINKRKAVIIDYNKQLSKNYFTLSGKLLPSPVMHRVFNNSSFRKGGRFFGGYFQQLSKKERKRLKINGEKSVELDFNCLHINLIYSKIKKTYNKDAYIIPTYSSIDYRNSIKLIAIIMINSSSRNTAIQSIRFAMSQKKIMDLNPEIAVNELIEKHHLIKDYFFNELGLNLQYQESIICERIMKSFMYRKSPIVVLPIHDGFICELKHKNKLLRCMKSAFKRITGHSNIKIKEVY